MPVDFQELKKGFDSYIKEANISADQAPSVPASPKGVAPSQPAGTNSPSMISSVWNKGSNFLSGLNHSYNPVQIASDKADQVTNTIKDTVSQVGQMAPLMMLPMLAGGMGGGTATPAAAAPSIGGLASKLTSPAGFKYGSYKTAMPVSVKIPTKLPGMNQTNPTLLPSPSVNPLMASKGFGAQAQNGANRFLANGVVKKSVVVPILMKALQRHASNSIADSASQPYTAPEVKPAVISSKDPEVEKALENPAVTAYIHKLVAEN